MKHYTKPLFDASERLVHVQEYESKLAMCPLTDKEKKPLDKFTINHGITLMNSW